MAVEDSGRRTKKGDIIWQAPQPKKKPVRKQTYVNGVKVSDNSRVQNKEGNWVLPGRSSQTTQRSAPAQRSAPSDQSPREIPYKPLRDYAERDQDIPDKSGITNEGIIMAKPKSIFSSSFWSFQGQAERIGNIGSTFKSIGSNFISGKWFKGVNIAPKFQGSALGKFAGFITSPATILTLPAAAGAVRLAAPMVLPSIGKAVSGLGRAAAPLGRGLGSPIARKALGTGLIGIGAYSGIRSLSRTVEKGGLGAIISGTGTTGDQMPRDITVFEGVDPSGNPIKISHEGDQVPGGGFYQLPNGEIVPYLSEQSAQPGFFGGGFGLPDVPGMPEGSGLSGWVPIAAVGLGVYLLTKGR